MPQRIDNRHSTVKKKKHIHWAYRISPNLVKCEKVEKEEEIWNQKRQIAKRKS